MKQLSIRNLVLAVVAVCTVSSCAKKLDVFPPNDLSPEAAYSDAKGYKGVLAKIYGSMSLGGNAGGAGAPDISGLDEGSQIAFIRMFFNCQELPTDEAVVSWNDQTIQSFHNFNWGPGDPFLKGLYARLVYNVTLINGYIREAADDKLAARGITGADAADIKRSVSEVRFLRAFNYWAMMDIFGNSTFITEADLPGTTLPPQIKRADLFAYIESELKAIETTLGEPRTVEYGRVDRAAAWALLARMYLNAEVYAKTPKYTEAITYAKKVIDAGYTLSPKYRELFMADNHKHTNELIWTITCDGLKTQGYGNTTFLINCPAGDDASYSYGSNGWYGYRATKALTNAFGSTGLEESKDQRALFTTYVLKDGVPTVKFSPTLNNDEISIEINNADDIGNFNKGVHVNKFVNIRSDGLPTSDINKTFADIDFPVFRLPEMYLIYAEAIRRGGAGGDINLAATLLTNLRKRSLSMPNPEVYPADLTLEYLLEERARELYWEGHRRTDLVRYGLLTSGDYLWPMKGGIGGGTAVDSKYNLFPIPAEFRTSNPNLEQNPGY
jgi:starch-binding outer membrane protein, SusD/RagB family